MSRQLLLTLACAGVASALGCALRVGTLRPWPDPFYEVVQYESALAARAIWIQHLHPHPSEGQRRWAESVGRKYVTSPPLLPAVVACCYAAAAEEVPWVSRLVTALLWLAGGWAVFAAALRFTGSRAGALAGMSWFMLTPAGVTVSRSFQVEAPLVAGFALALWCLARADCGWSWRAVCGTGLVLGAVCFVKPGILFLPVLGGLAGAILGDPRAGGRSARVAKLGAGALLTVAPAVAYAMVMLRHHVGKKIAPELLTEWAFYRALAGRVEDMIGVPALALALLGLGLVVRHRAFPLIGAAVGYAGYCLLFSHHTCTHSYYHAPLFPLVGVLIAFSVAAALRSRLLPAVLATRPLALLAAFGLVATGYAVVTDRYDIDLGRGRARARARAPAEGPAAAPPAEREGEQYRHVRRLVPPGASVIVLGREYGYPLDFHAWVNSRPWPNAIEIANEPPGERAAAGRFRRLEEQAAASYFVVADLDEYRRQPDLRALLERTAVGRDEGELSIVYALPAPAGARP